MKAESFRAVPLSSLLKICFYVVIMLTWYAALEITNLKVINDAISGGMGLPVYRELAHYFIGNKIGWLHASGIVKRVLPSFRSSVFGDVYHYAKQLDTQKEVISHASGYSILDDDDLVERPFMNPRKYRYIGEFTYYDQMTGKDVVEYRSYYTDQSLSIAQANTFLHDTFEENPSDSEKSDYHSYLKHLKLDNIEINESAS